jgi:hypothetical protein
MGLTMAEQSRAKRPCTVRVYVEDISSDRADKLFEYLDNHGFEIVIKVKEPLNRTAVLYGIRRSIFYIVLWGLPIGVSAYVWHRGYRPLAIVFAICLAGWELIRLWFIKSRRQGY